MSAPRFVVATDGSENAAAALSVAIDLASGTRGRLVLVHVFEPLAHLEEMGGGRDFGDLEEDARRSLEGAWSAAIRDAGLRYETRLVHGGPAEAVLDVADEVAADYVVVGRRGLGRLQTLLLGSTSAVIAQTSSRPVVIVPPSSM